ncbi:family 16 glycosylhydrolase [Hydrogenophaga taeniospiralis]|uniref:glycoside hydrolase family 16 protein n=1 Tax=Hydrogenophaga taeniospiralis TaxID=65656 RepID=UPI001CF9595E|nr:glycoside hydrolase family 16 protein [Hydrogenophaga taeniospiralis]UCU94182.1 glycoside hydrolase family 16 protein [Hydrogenophaga taeniospiralis]
MTSFSALIVLLLLVSVLPSSQLSQTMLPPHDGNWEIIWSDEFDGNKLDAAKWSYGIDGPRGDGLWSKENVFLDGRGNLVFRANILGDQFVGAGIDSYRRFAVFAGLFSFRCKLPKLPGFRPAIWLSTPGVESVGNDGRDGTEIDIMEQPGRSAFVHLNLHWDGYKDDHKTTGTIAPIIGTLDDWHSFTLVWTENEYVFYVDNVESWRTSAGGVSQVPQFIRMGIETPWRPSRFELDSQTDEDYFICDYVRVYKKAL